MRACVVHQGRTSAARLRRVRGKVDGASIPICAQVNVPWPGVVELAATRGRQRPAPVNSGVRAVPVLRADDVRLGTGGESARHGRRSQSIPARKRATASRPRKAPLGQAAGGMSAPRVGSPGGADAPDGRAVPAGASGRQFQPPDTRHFRGAVVRSGSAIIDRRPPHQFMRSGHTSCSQREPDTAKAGEQQRNTMGVTAGRDRQPNSNPGGSRGERAAWIGHACPRQITRQSLTDGGAQPSNRRPGTKAGIKPGRARNSIPKPSASRLSGMIWRAPVWRAGRLDRLGAGVRGVIRGRLHCACPLLIPATALDRPRSRLWCELGRSQAVEAGRDRGRPGTRQTWTTAGPSPAFAPYRRVFGPHNHAGRFMTHRCASNLLFAAGAAKRCDLASVNRENGREVVADARQRIANSRQNVVLTTFSRR